MKALISTKFRAFAIWSAIFVSAAICSGYSPEEKMTDPALEMRAQSLYRQIRCVVCDGQDIAHSNAELAVDMRVKIREQLRAGMSDAVILDWLSHRYGEEIRARPSLQGWNLGLWLLPILFLCASAFIVGIYIFRAQRKLSA